MRETFDTGITPIMRKVSAIAASALAVFAPALAHAQNAAASTLPDAADSGDTAWVLAAAVLGLALALPGLALFGAGRLRANNRLSLAMHCALIAAVVALAWILCGYTLAFGRTDLSRLGAVVGAGNGWMLLDLAELRGDLAIPESAFALLQIALAMFAAAAMAGAWAERARLGWALGFAGLWSVIVYAPIVHWLWGDGWLASHFGTVDFAGGLGIHTAAGVSALVAALLVGPRRSLSSETSPAMTLGGAGLLFSGLMALTGAMAMAANDDAASALIAALSATAAGALAGAALARISHGQVSPASLAMGAIAGLVAVSGGAGCVSPGAAMVIGVIGALTGQGALKALRWSGIDDALGVFALHGAPGMAGALLAGVFLAPELGGTGFADGMDFVNQIGAQLVGIGVVTIWSALASAALAVGVSVLTPMRVSEEAEDIGLDLALHAAEPR